MLPFSRFAPVSSFGSFCLCKTPDGGQLSILDIALRKKPLSDGCSNKTDLECDCALDLQASGAQSLMPAGLLPWLAVRVSLMTTRTKQHRHIVPYQQTTAKTACNEFPCSDCTRRDGVNRNQYLVPIVTEPFRRGETSTRNPPYRMVRARNAA